jgi:hypothetical protein
MRGVCILGLMCFLGMTPALHADPPEALDRLIEQLGSREFRQRDEANKAILAQGTTALGVLNKSRSHPDAEVRQRVEELIGQLERRAALAARRVSLHLIKKPITDALAEVAKQSGYSIPMDGNFGAALKKTTGTFEFDNVPFWEALDRVCDAGGLVLDHMEGDTTLRLVKQDHHMPYRSYDGTFKVMATGFQYTLNSQFGQISRHAAAPAPTSNESLQFNFTVNVEPRLPIMRLGAIRLTEALDEEGHSMLLPDLNLNNSFQQQQVRFYRGGLQRTYSQGASVGLAWPSKSSKTVKSMKGMIGVTLLAEQKPLVVTDQLDSAAGKNFRAGTATFHVVEVTKQAGNQRQYKVTFTDETYNSFDYSQVQMVPQRVEVQDSKGNKIPANCMIQMYHGPASIDFVIHTQGFPGRSTRRGSRPAPTQGGIDSLPPTSNQEVGPPARLVFQHWVQMEHEVAFEFKDLPLP